jgi:glycosyltransferase involved in cell wall biosynthesis
MKLAISLHTYQRLDGQTPTLIQRALTSIANQTYQDFVLFVVGDKYEDSLEFSEIILKFLNDFPSMKNKIHYHNLTYAKERDKYLNINNTALWNCGGANALNFATEWFKINGLTKICHIDHDDYWMPNHLEVIAKAIKEKNNPAFLHTLSKYIHHKVFPEMVVDGSIIEHYPSYANLIHSSVYIDFNQIPFEYRDLYAEEQRYFPSDGDMWERIRLHCEAHNLKCYAIREVTCVHEQENY